MGGLRFRVGVIASYRYNLTYSSTVDENAHRAAGRPAAE